MNVLTMSLILLGVFLGLMVFGLPFALIMVASGVILMAVSSRALRPLRRPSGEGMTSGGRPPPC